MSPETEKRVREIVQEMLDEARPLPPFPFRVDTGDALRAYSNAISDALREHTKRNGSRSVRTD